MGCSNYVNFICPKCKNTIQAYSNAGSCRMKIFSSQKVPLLEAEDLLGDEIECKICQTTFTIDGNYPRFVTLFLTDKPKEDEDDFC